jgi:hypothetical protein
MAGPDKQPYGMPVSWSMLFRTMRRVFPGAKIQRSIPCLRPGLSTRSAIKLAWRIAAGTSRLTALLPVSANCEALGTTSYRHPSHLS